MPQTEKPLSSIASKIRALLNMTTQNGCTEDEAMLAASRAATLLQKHNLSLSEVEVASEGFETILWAEATVFDSQIVAFLIDEIERLTHTASFRRKCGNHYRPVIVGLTSDAIFAEWLLKTLTATIRRAAEDFLRKSRLGRKTAAQSLIMRRSFAFAMAQRISERLKTERHTQDNNLNGTGLVPVSRKKMAEDELARQTGKLRPARGMTLEKINASSVAAGSQAAEAVTWSKPIEPPSKARLLT